METRKTKVVAGVLFLMVLFCAADYTAAQSDPNLLAWWNFDGNTNDTSGNEYHAVPFGDPRYAVGITGSDLGFDGVDDFVWGDLDEPETEVTHMLWFKTTNPNAGIFSVVRGYFGAAGNDRHIYLHNGNLYARIYDHEVIGTTELDLADGQWHHVAHVFGDSIGGQKIYVNGAESAEGSKAASDFDWQTGVMIGYSGDAAAKYFSGQIDDVRIYSKALVEGEILDILVGAVESSSLGTFNIGDIPSKSVWHGKEYSFLVDWEERAGVSYSMTLEPSPAGAASLLPIAGGELGLWEFSYVPDASDKFPFTVSITADDGIEMLRQSFDIIPMPNLVPEQIVFDPNSHTGAGQVGADDVIEHETKGPARSMNHQPSKQPRRIQLQAKTIIFEAGHENGLYETYNGDLNTETIELIAETVIIRSPLHFPQTEVIINARELRFESSTAQIKTTPIKKTAIPGRSQPGGNGLRAGNVTLNIGSFYASHGNLKFDLRGGPGQDGGGGKDGTPGTNVASYWSTFDFRDSGINFSYTAPSGEYIIYEEAWNTCLFGIPIKVYDYPVGGISKIPTSGAPATISGKPGKGGPGGILKISLDVTAFSHYSEVGPGQAGRTPAQWDPQYAGRTSFYGGAAGRPSKWRKMKCHYCLAGNFWATDDYSKHGGPTTKGADKPVVQPDAPAASDYGRIECPSCATPWTGNTYEWMGPVAVRILFNEAKDDYLNEDFRAAQDRMLDLTQMIAAYQDSPQWDSLAQMSRYELLQMYDNMKTLLYQIENNRDYFGNPAGWVPMLSFEAYIDMFDIEIDRAIRALYLAHWIKNTAASQTDKENALLEMRIQLQSEIDDAYDDYDDALSRMGSLKTHAAAIKQTSDAKILRLEALENQLEWDASLNLREPWWKTSLKMAGVLCKMIPIQQPIAGFIGEGLTIAANFDPDDPYSTVIQSTQLVDTIVETTIDDVAAAVGIVASAATGDVGGAISDTLGEIGEAIPSLTDGINGMVEVLQGIEAPAEEIQAELERLKGQSPEFKQLAEEIEDLLDQQATFARDLAETMLALASNINLIRENLQAMDALREDLATVEIPDPRALTYLDNLERRSLRRLLKYHYYMAKAYEYRLLEEYTEPLDLGPFFDHLVNNTYIGEGINVIPQEQFDTLKSLYQDKIATVAEKIFTDYSSHTPELSAPVRFNLTQDELDRINQGQTVRLNLMDLGIFPADEENIRIFDLEIFAIDTIPIDGDYEQNAQVDIRFEHSGLSRLMSKGQTYLFRHYNEQTDDPIVWGGRYFPVDDDVIAIKPSAAQISLLKTLLSETASQDMLLYSRPAAWADLEISLSVYNNAGRDIDVSYLRCQLTYDFTRRPSKLFLADIQLMVSEAYLDDTNDLIVSEADFQPYVVCDTPDRNGRQDARGHVHRIYPASELTTIQVTTQKKYANWKFNKWTDRYGNDLAGGPVTDRTIGIIPATDQTIVAQYVPLDTLSGDINSDCIIGIGDLKSLVDSWLLIHPSINLDESDTEGMIDLADFAGLAADWGKTCEQVLNEASGAAAAAMSINTLNVAGPMSRVSNPRNIEWVEQ